MIGKKIQDALNQQINAELYSSYLYLSMAAHFESENLSGFAQWMRAQSAEETGHAMKFFDFVIERGGDVSLAAIDGPPTEWASPLAVFEETLKHEQKVTGLINDLVDLARSEKDHAAEIFLQWFVTEQVEEESSVEDALHKLRLAGDAPNLLFMLDRELGGRPGGAPAAGGQ
jgi:ferritin